MVKVANLVHSTTIHMAHSTGAIPGPVISCVSVFNQIHRMWRWFRLGKIYTNPDNFLKLAAGHALNFAAGNSVLLRISAVCVLIATRIMDCVSQHFKLQEAWNQLVLCLKKRFITPVKVAWEKKISQNFLSASTVAWWKFHALHLWDVVHRFVVCLLNLCKEIFILCMRITDAVETFALKPSTTNESINLLFVNASQWISNLVENKQILLEGLKSNKEIIDAILKGIHSFINADQLIKTAEDALNATEKIHASVQGISHTFGVFMMTCLKKWGFEFLHGLGLHHLIPKQLLPRQNPPGKFRNTK